MCQCYQIGGPFIAEDPECPEHGVEGVRRQRAADDLQAEVQQLRAQLAATRAVLAEAVMCVVDDMRPSQEKLGSWYRQLKES